MKSVILPSVQIIGESAFQFSGVEDAVFSELIEVEQNAFSNCSELVRFEADRSVARRFQQLQKAGGFQGAKFIKCNRFSFPPL